ncbi:hypothetical protein H010_19752 [Hydrogenophaga taeniospiralis CCUG 15921]|uniref:DUF3306 domain-containing protein n=1 Tax=Hydrogenophaga taeniospiralis CCUG 15921 TaxID=1281780 RepID=A0A9X4NVQ3_9BURK|nr:DUF3306 domain-containing protein [Hydrogenophaga taeniospiralis]MDG5977501.1 hypothetical protein [Hydrogenophaga taeniospiralis CCUG 15921]
MKPDEDDNFFSRWSRRKAQVRSGQPLPAEPPAPEPPVAVAPVTAPGAVEGLAPATSPPPVSAGPAEPPPAPTLEDVARLSLDGDFKPFVARGVPAEVRNAAVKKLFTDPRYNVMDGLDIYIDDYSKPSPLSAVDMAKMVGAQFLKLVDDPNEVKPPVAPVPVAATEAHAAEPEEAPALQVDAPEQVAQPDPPEPHDDHADLQLQPDHAAEPQDPGRGAG